MFVTDLKFRRLLEWFLVSKFDYLLLYASGTNKSNCDIANYIYDNRYLIDRQTGTNVCFISFIDRWQGTLLNAADYPFQSRYVEDFLMYHIKEYDEAQSVSIREIKHGGASIRATLEATEEMCDFFGILRYELPAFILIFKSFNTCQIDSFSTNKYIFPIKDIDDIDALLSPLNLINDYISDIESIESLPQLEQTLKIPQKRLLEDVFPCVRSIQTEIKKLQSQTYESLQDEFYGIIKSLNQSLSAYNITFDHTITPTGLKKVLTSHNHITEFMQIHNDLYHKFNSLYNKFIKWDKRDSNRITTLTHNIEKRLQLFNYLQDKELSDYNITLEKILSLRKRKENRVEIESYYKKQLEEMLLVEDASYIFQDIQDKKEMRPHILIQAMKNNLLKKANINTMIQTLRQQVQDNFYNIFISCKSEDYEKAEEVYSFLKSKGYKPFLASKSLREIGNASYNLVISEVLKICKHLIVFASNIEYTEAPFVISEWNSFITEIKAGRKSGNLLTIIPNPKDGDKLPYDLSHREIFAIDTYKDNICFYLD